jgi:hypothetical protein
MSVSEQLTDDQLTRAVPGSVFMRYPDLAHFHSIDDVLSQSPIQVVFLLYLIQTSNSGHYCSVFRRNDGIIEFFDPYGFAADSELSFITAIKRRELHEDTPLLLRLLVAGQQTEKWTWNSFDLQSHDPAVQDCGRWNIWRTTRRDLDDKEFHELVRREAKADGNDFDAACVRITEPLLGR